MRTIKFRGKHINSGEWMYGDLHLLCDAPHIHMEVSKYPYAGKRAFVAPDSVGQFTGLFDKNNKEIYEGDLLSSPLSEVNPFGMVAWHPNGYFFIDTKFGKQTPTEDHRTLGEMLNYKIGSRSTEFEVVGNIYDNPEMLEGGDQ